MWLKGRDLPLSVLVMITKCWTSEDTLVWGGLSTLLKQRGTEALRFGIHWMWDTRLDGQLLEVKENPEPGCCLCWAFRILLVSSLGAWKEVSAQQASSAPCCCKGLGLRSKPRAGFWWPSFPCTLQSQKENSCYLVRFMWEFLSSGEAFGPQCTWKSAACAQHSWAVWQGKGWDEGSIGSSWPAPPWCRQSLLVSPSFKNNIVFYDFHGSWCRSLFIKYSSNVWGQKWKI